MPEYRIFTLAENNRIVAPPEVVNCETDREAIEQAKLPIDEYDVEVRQGARRVIRLTPLDVIQSSWLSG